MECAITQMPINFSQCGAQENEKADEIQMSESIFMFPNRPIGSRDNVLEGEVRSSVYGVRHCVIKFSTLSAQNINEYEILTKLGSHTNVIAIIEAGTYRDIFGDRVYIALDKCHKENLRQYLRNQKAAGIEFDLNQAIDFAKQMIAGVMYIHDNNVIHLDLKPSNILISQDLRLIKIADFGLSIVVKSSKSRVFHKHQFGTNGYRPIESFGNGLVSQRTDVFSFGAVLFHLLSNGMDLFGSDEHMFTHNVLNDIYDTTGLLVRNPITTGHLIKCMVSPDRRRRPTIREVSNHPCWSGQEVKCNFGYFDDEECDDSLVDVGLDECTAPTEFSGERELVKMMKKLGFDRKPSIVLFDDKSERLYYFDDRRKALIEFQDYSEQQKYMYFSVVTLGEYVYVIYDDRAVYRLEYGDSMATWEKMSSWIADHGNKRPPVVVSSTSIILVGGELGSEPVPTTAVSSFDPELDQWEILYDKPIATKGSALLCVGEFLYCLGGNDESNKPTSIVEKFDLRRMEWMRVTNMINESSRACAASYRENIYVVDHRRDSLNLETYDVNADQWSELKSLQIENTSIRRTFIIKTNLLVVCDNQIVKYDLERDEWTVVTSYTNMDIYEAVVVQMST